MKKFVSVLGGEFKTKGPEKNTAYSRPFTIRINKKRKFTVRVVFSVRKENCET